MVNDNIKQRKILPQSPPLQYGSEESMTAEQNWSDWKHKNKGQVIHKREGGQLQNWKIVCRKLWVPSLKEGRAFSH